MVRILHDDLSMVGQYPVVKVFQRFETQHQQYCFDAKIRVDLFTGLVELEMEVTDPVNLMSQIARKLVQDGHLAEEHEEYVFNALTARQR